MATTTNYGWTTPDDTALVKDGAAAIRTLGSSVDTTTKALNPSTTLGDMEYRSSTANTNTRLGIGTTGQVLAVTGGVPAWTTISAGGMTLINSGGTTLTGASITISSIPGTYKNLQLFVENFKPATDGQALMLRFNSDAGANRHFTNESFGKPAAISFNSTSIVCSESSDNTTAQGLITINIPDYANATTWKFITSFGITNDATTSTNARSNMTTGGYNQTGAITDITLFSSSGNLTSGTAFLYGVS
jgi:hypothetical protein